MPTTSERLSVLLASAEEEVAVRKTVSRETMSRKELRKIKELEQVVENLRKELEMERKRAKELEQRTRKSMYARNIVKQETQKMQACGAPSRSQDDELKRYREMLEIFLPPGVSIEDLDMSLEEAEERLKGALQILLNTEDEAEQMKAQQDFDRFDGIIRNHPDYKKRELEKWEKWESDNMPKNKEALETMKSIVKEEYLTKSVEEMKALGLREALAKRIKEKTVFQLFYKTPDEISKLHHVALQNYNCQGLDIVERRALYQCLPSEWVNDGGGQKARWKDDFREKLSEVITSEKNGNLRGNDLRNFAYKKDAPAKNPDIHCPRPHPFPLPTPPRPRDDLFPLPTPGRDEVTSSKPSPAIPDSQERVRPAFPPRNKFPNFGPSSDNDESKTLNEAELADLRTSLKNVFGTKNTSASIASSSSSSSSSAAAVEGHSSKGNDDSTLSAISSSNGSVIKSSNSTAGQSQLLDRFLETSFSSEKSADRDDSKSNAMNKIISDDLLSSLKHSLHQTFEC